MTGQAINKIERFRALKVRGEKISMLTAYDYPTASLVDQANVDAVLVGDSLANVVLGLASTKEIGMQEMCYHGQAVRRGVKNALMVVDMPYCAYQVQGSSAVDNARKLIQETSCEAVKLEWFDGALRTAKDIISAGIAVMGHVGLTPQTADRLGGFKVQGKDAESARKIMSQALALEQAGCFSVVLECIPTQVAFEITNRLKIPTIGIGAGGDCDGQVLVLHDLLGLTSGFHPKFAKQYSDLSQLILKCVKDFNSEVKSGIFPDKNYSFQMPSAELEKIRNLKENF